MNTNELLVQLPIQFFAGEGEGQDNAAEQAEQVEQADDNDTQTAEKDEKLLSQSEVNDIVQNRVNRILAEKEKEVAEAKKLAKMNADEKAEYERKKLADENESLKLRLQRVELAKETRNMLTNAGIKVNDKLVESLTGNDAESTKEFVEQYIELFKESVEDAVKTQLAGNVPTKKVTQTTATNLNVDTMTYDEIAALKENNPDLFNSLFS